MRPLGEAAVLDTWTDRPAGRAAILERLAGLLLGPAAAGQPWDAASAGLLRLAAAAGRADVLVSCPACRAGLEAVVPVGALLAAGDDADGADAQPEGAAGAAVRAPSVADMVAVADLPGEQAAAELAHRCGLDRLAPAERERVLAAWDDARPLLAPSLASTCPSCGAQVQAPVDVVGLAWAALGDLARALLDDVAVLARGFGWSEAQVLAVPPARRRWYRAVLAGTAAG